MGWAAVGIWLTIPIFGTWHFGSGKVCMYLAAGTAWMAAAVTARAVRFQQNSADYQPATALDHYAEL
jgi:hypothetical protein